MSVEEVYGRLGNAKGGLSDSRAIGRGGSPRAKELSRNNGISGHCRNRYDCQCNEGVKFQGDLEIA